MSDLTDAELGALLAEHSPSSSNELVCNWCADRVPCATARAITELRAHRTENLNLHHTVDCQEAEIAELRAALERLNEAATGIANDPQSPYARKEFIEATAAADEALARVRGAE